MGVNYWPTFLSGIENSVNSVSLIALSFLGCLLALFLKDKRRLLVLGYLFIAGYFLSTFLWVIGGWDRWLQTMAAGYLTIGSYFLILVYLIFSAFDYFRKWLGLRVGKTVSEFSWITKIEKMNVVWLGLLAFVLGCGVCLLGAYWPQDYYMFLIFSYMVANAKVGLSLGAFFIYALANVSLLAVLFVIAQILASRTLKEKELSMVFIVMAGLSLSSAIGLAYLFFNNLIIIS